MEWNITTVKTLTHCDSCEKQIYLCSICEDRLEERQTIICYEKEGKTHHKHKGCINFD